MEQVQESKSEVKPPKEPDKPKKELTEEQRQKQKKFIIYPLMGLIFAVVMWLIFAPSETEKAQEQVGFNTNVPAPADNKLVDDKQTAYEQEQAEQQEAEDVMAEIDGLADLDYQVSALESELGEHDRWEAARQQQAIQQRQHLRCARHIFLRRQNQRQSAARGNRLAVHPLLLKRKAIVRHTCCNPNHRQHFSFLQLYYHVLTPKHAI